MSLPPSSKAKTESDERPFSHVSAAAVVSKKARVSSEGASASVIVTAAASGMPGCTGVVGESFLSHEANSAAAAAASIKRMFFMIE